MEIKNNKKDIPNIRTLLIVMVLTTVAMAFTSCTNTQNEPLSMEISKVDINILPENQNTVDAYIYLKRKDAGFAQPENEDGKIKEGNLPKALQVKTLVLTQKDGNNTTNCETDSFPYKCTISLSKDDFEKNKFSYIVNTTFEDGVSQKGKLNITLPPLLSELKINKPTSLPKNNSKMNVSFTDVGADLYNIKIESCEQKKEDICTELVTYKIKNLEHGLFDESGIESEKLSPIIKIKDGEISLSSDFIVSYSEKLKLSIVAEKGYTSKQGGTKIAVISKLSTLFE